METTEYTAFDGDHRIVSGPLAEVAVHVQRAIGVGGPHDVLVFDDTTGRVVDLVLAGSPEDVAARYRVKRSAELGDQAATGRERPARRGPGRPKLGVVGREVTLLPRHWDWLASQPGGASVTLRKLVDRARKENVETDRVRRAREAAYRFLSAMAGDRPGFEEASRALFSGDEVKFERETEEWPADVRRYARELADGAWTRTD